MPDRAARFGADLNAGSSLVGSIGLMREGPCSCLFGVLRPAPCKAGLLTGLMAPDPGAVVLPLLGTDGTLASECSVPESVGLYIMVAEETLRICWRAWRRGAAGVGESTPEASAEVARGTLVLTEPSASRVRAGCGAGLVK